MSTEQKLEQQLVSTSTFHSVDMSRKLTSFNFWKQTLNSSKYIVAPMVDQSELVWRLLCRKYGAELCYTPMYHARMFGDEVSDKYRKDMFDAIEGQLDRPLVVQFCANDPDHLLKAAKLIEDKCDAVDINLGCPQHIARRGHYGSYLMEEWELIEKMVKNLHDNLNIPVTCKIRIFPEVEKTVRYAKMLEKAGCQLLTVHGRLREQKGHNTGLADWEQIRIVKNSVNIPVFANGNILYFEDIEKCMKATGVDGVMSAEALLYNPALFSNKEIPIYEIAEEYIKLCKEHPKLNKTAYIRAHLFKLYKSCLSMYTELRDQLATASELKDFEIVCNELNGKLKEDASKVNFEYTVTIDEKGIKQLPHWICQPYIRPENVHNQKKTKEEKEIEKKEKSIKEKDGKRKLENDNNNNIQTKRIPDKLICPSCPNVASSKCIHQACKKCCILKCKESNEGKEENNNEDKVICDIHYRIKKNRKEGRNNTLEKNNTSDNNNTTTEIKAVV